MAKKKRPQQQTQQQSPPYQSDRNRENANGAASNGNGNEKKEERLSPKEFYQKRLNDDVAKLQAGGFALVQNKTRDTAETRNFLNMIDSLMYTARMQAGPKGSRITYSDMENKFEPRLKKAKDELNLLCAELSRLVGKPYRPPRGYTDPLKGKPLTQQNQPEKAAGSEKAATAKPASPPPPAKAKAEKTVATASAAEKTPVATATA